ncbi:DUF3592 domain-containing protein [Roseofilum sp. BLCC_M91]|uniref:DUF3592 domain-containing protein n=1 Tax=Roseofilum halophilum BLCC-M91 TaxID=3022259 RepID=A0ABT7BNM5_9CYAN|nr:DUF3592 domain-containing protein [Roseofilum halophilum]MDJ1180792.1 DUF3592 domain-containing protein [Roseofilum halophilum BLCC-M91]
MSGSNQKTLKVVGITFSSIGFLLLIVTGVLGFNTRSFLEVAKKAEGSVVELIRRRSSNSSSSTSRSYVFHPVIQFETANGEAVEFESNRGSNPPAFQTGQSVIVLYNPEEVNQAKIDSFWDLWLIAMITGLNGSVFFFIGVVLLYFAIRQGGDTTS